MAILFYLLLFFMGDAEAELSWSSEKAPGFSIVVEPSRESVPIDKKLQVQATLYAERGYRVSREALRRNLLSNASYGAPPFSLIAEEAVVRENNVERLLYTLDPQIPGITILTFGKVTFIPEGETGEVVEFMTGTFTIAIAMAEELLGENPRPAKLMELSTALPIAVSEENIDRYLDNKRVAMGEEEAIRRSLLPKEGFSIGFALLLSLKLALLFSALLGRES